MLLILVGLLHWDTDCGLCGKIFTDHDVSIIFYLHIMTKDMTGHKKQAKLHVGKFFSRNVTLSNCFNHQFTAFFATHVICGSNVYILLFCTVITVRFFEKKGGTKLFYLLRVINISIINSNDSKMLIENLITIATNKAQQQKIMKSRKC